MRNLFKPFISLVIMIVVAGTIVYAGKRQTALKTPSAAKFVRSFPDDARSVLENCDKLTLYSLKPAYNFKADGSPFQEGFHDYPVLGKTDIPVERRAEVVAQLYNGLAVPDNFITFGCFSPRHGLRAEKGKQYVDLVICFSCQQMQVFTERRPDQMTTGISSEPRPAFNRVLIGAHIPLDPKNAFGTE